jgi:hypothetical protein
MSEENMDTVLERLLLEAGAAVIKAEEIQQKTEDLRELIEDAYERVGITPDPEGAVPLYSLKAVVGRLRGAFDGFSETKGDMYDHLSAQEKETVEEAALDEFTSALEALEDLCA